MSRLTPFFAIVGVMTAGAFHEGIFVGVMQVRNHFACRTPDGLPGAEICVSKFYRNPLNSYSLVTVWMVTTPSVIVMDVGTFGLIG